MEVQEATVQRGAKRNPLFVIYRGEDLVTAMKRHYQDHGRGPLVLVRDYNVTASRTRRGGGVRQRAAA